MFPPSSRLAQHEDHDVQEKLWRRNPDTDWVQRCPLKAGISNRQKSSRLGAAVLAPLASPGRQFITDHGAAVRYQKPCNCFSAVAAPNYDQ